MYGSLSYSVYNNHSSIIPNKKVNRFKDSIYQSLQTFSLKKEGVSIQRNLIQYGKSSVSNNQTETMLALRFLK